MLIAQEAVKVTTNFSVWQYAATVISVIGAVFFILGYARQQLFKFLTEWKQSELEYLNSVAKKQQDLEDHQTVTDQKVDAVHACLHNLPDHPENPANKGTPSNE